MNALRIINSLTDRYERQARLFPALLALGPLVVAYIGLHGVALEMKTSAVGLVAAFGVFFLLASIARELGKRLEEGLFAAWGGKPSTQLLRHRDHRIDPVTKARYLAFLAARLGARFPTATDEVRDPQAADNVYTSAARWLLDQTRDTRRFGLLFKENIAYGFRRNCLGLKPLALGIAVLAALWVLIASGVVRASGFDVAAVQAMPAGAIAALVVAVVAIFIWLLFVTQRTVKTAAFMYGELLLRACDVVSDKNTDDRRSVLLTSG